MTHFDDDLAYFKQGLENLEEYLLSQEVYWNLPGLPSLTLGGMLLTQVRLQEDQLTPEKQEVVQSNVQQLETIKLKWRVAWENKTLREIPSRLILWKNFLMDHWDGCNESADVYSQEVRWRVMLQLLINEVAGVYKEKAAIELLDNRLRLSFEPGDFIWSVNLQKKFSSPEYWFLYGHPKKITGGKI
jgi:hypothetical protein